jgi:hypothetical protein
MGLYRVFHLVSGIINEKESWQYGKGVLNYYVLVEHGNNIVKDEKMAII